MSFGNSLILYLYKDHLFESLESYVNTDPDLEFYNTNEKWRFKEVFGKAIDQ